ncbi:arylesterase [Candidatus Kaiserbacteria bacterium]|nr:MAG: arylesterase [Candidatus Kaiserbacteria bacterium]
MNMSIFWTILGVLLLCILAYFLLRDDTRIINYPPKGGPIVAFGDSLVRGVGSPETEGFVLTLASKIGEPIINKGVPGDTTTDGLARIDTVLESNPRIVLVLLGGNDRLRQIPTEQTLANLRMIISKIQESGAVVVLLGVRGNLLTGRFDEELEKLAHEMGAVFVSNVLDGIFGNQQLMFDSVHPNKDGYALISEKVYEVIGTVLR